MTVVVALTTTTTLLPQLPSALLGCGKVSGLLPFAATIATIFRVLSAHLATPSSALPSRLRHINMSNQVKKWLLL
jgi:hypothetical protein